MSDTIKRRPNLLPSYTVGQALAAFHGDPVIAYDRKSEIWINDATYSSYFKEETRAKHIIFAYSLHKAISDKKLDLIVKHKENTELTKIEKEQLAFMEKKGAIHLTCAAVADCLEIILGKPLPNKFRLSFGDKISPVKAEELWSEILDPLLALVGQLNGAFSANRINTEAAKKSIPAFRSVVAAVSSANQKAFKKFAAAVKSE